MKNVFITGISGFVGSHLAKELIEKGADVTGLQHDIKKKSYLDLLDIKDKVNLVNGDIKDVHLLQRILVDYKITHIFHLAGITIVGKAPQYPMHTYQTNAFGTLALLEACRMQSHQIKVIAVASSDKCYGESGFVTEDAPLEGMGIYENSKACADLIARAYYYTYKLPIVVLRPANVVGFDPLNSRIVPNTIKKCMERESPEIFKGVKGFREYIYIGDVLNAYLSVADADNIEKTRGNVYNAGSGEIISQEDMVNLIASHFDVAPVYVDPEEWRGKEIKTQSLNSDKIYKDTGWKAKTSIAEGIRHTIEEFKKWKEAKKN